MAGPEAPQPLYLSKQELRILTELALKSPTTLVDGYRLGGLLQKVEQIVNGQYDLVQDFPSPVVPEAAYPKLV